jgi:hypothetical protein
VQGSRAVGTDVALHCDKDADADNHLHNYVGLLINIDNLYLHSTACIIGMSPFIKNSLLFTHNKELYDSKDVIRSNYWYHNICFELHDQ